MEVLDGVLEGVHLCDTGDGHLVEARLVDRALAPVVVGLQDLESRSRLLLGAVDAVVHVACRLLAGPEEVINHLHVHVGNLVLGDVLGDADSGVLLLGDDLQHLGRGEEGGRDVVREALDVARETAGGLVGVRLVRDVEHDAVGEEELVVLEGDAAAQAEVARDGEGVLLKIVLVVNLSDDPADLFGGARLNVDVGGDGNRLCAPRDENLLADTVDDDDGEALRGEEARDGLVGGPLHVSRREEADTGLREVRAVLLEDVHEVVGCRQSGNVLLHDEAVLHLVVDREHGLEAGEDADGPVLLEDAVVGGGDKSNLVDLGEGGDVDRGLGPEVDGRIGLVNPDVDLLVEEAALLEVGQEGVEVGQALSVRAADHHGDLALLDAVGELAHGDVVVLEARAPLEAGALNLGVRQLVLLVVGEELLVHADFRLVDQGAVVGRDDDVEEAVAVVLLRGDVLERLDALHHVPRLPALAREPNAVKLASERTHCWCERVGWKGKSTGWVLKRPCNFAPIKKGFFFCFVFFLVFSFCL